ncbi:SET domain-containing protein-lysine N-methyltransferase [bacterium]|nr:SET domain-containing protein-lysine N-methyltransferase [bacterium]
MLTAIDIYKEEVIAVFTGEIISDDEAERRMKKEEDNYFINLLDGRIMDSKHTFCFAKFANDATGNGKTPFKNNAKIALNDNDEVCLIATRKIKAGEEIFCGYGREYWKKHSEKGNH